MTSGVVLGLGLDIFRSVKSDLIEAYRSFGGVICCPFLRKHD